MAVFQKSAGDLGNPGGAKMRRYLSQFVVLTLSVSVCFTSVLAQPSSDFEIASMTNEEKVSNASNARRRLAESADRIAEMRKSAVAAEEDASRIRCLNEAVVSVNGFLTVASQSYENLQVAVSSNDTRSANHHLMMVSTSAQRASSIEASAAQCVGGALRYAGDTQTIQNVDSRMAEYDPMAFDEDSGGAFVFLEELPPKASAER